MWHSRPRLCLVYAAIGGESQPGAAVPHGLVVTGEFGRTPRINSAVGTETRVMQPGRDHWPNAMSVLVAGGGMRTGQVVGSTNSRGEHPQDRPLTPNDLWATIYRHLGIDPEISFSDHSGRPMPILPFGEPIAELLPVIPGRTSYPSGAPSRGISTSSSLSGW